MMLFVRKGCDFCKNLPHIKGLRILEVSQTSKGPKIMIEGELIPVPPTVKGLPALLIGNELLMGKNIVSDRIKKIAADIAAGGT